MTDCQKQNVPKKNINPSLTQILGAYSGEKFPIHISQNLGMGPAISKLANDHFVKLSVFIDNQWGRFNVHS